MLELASIALLLGTILGLGMSGEKQTRLRTDSRHMIRRPVRAYQDGFNGVQLLRVEGSAPLRQPNSPASSLILPL